jgi:hypothetical protein
VCRPSSSAREIEFANSANPGLGRSKSLGSLKDFKMFGVSKGGGPLDGILRMLRMLL